MPASAALTAKHTWFMLSGTTGKCGLSPQSPQSFYANSIGMAGMGLTVERIVPQDVIKDDKGDIHVTVHATVDGTKGTMEFFTSLANCDQYVKDNHVTPQGAPDADIN